MDDGIQRCQTTHFWDNYHKMLNNLLFDAMREFIIIVDSRCRYSYSEEKKSRIVATKIHIIVHQCFYIGIYLLVVTLLM